MDRIDRRSRETRVTTRVSAGRDEAADVQRCSTTETASSVRGTAVNLKNQLFSRFPLPVESRLPPFSGATGWLNSRPLLPTALHGKVVAVDFWTYTCINWLRTLPYIRAWADTYAAHGLVMVGVHTPEF